MADNWSASTITLTNAGDWAKWSMDVPDSTKRDDLNGNATIAFGVRGAYSAAAREAILGVVINDTVFVQGAGSDPSSGGWVSADRFAPLGVGNGSVGKYAVEFPALFLADVGIDDATPFITGTNTVRLLHFGRLSDLGAEAVEVDFVAFTAGAGLPTLFQSTLFGDDATADTKPAFYDAHVNPNPSGGGPPPLWILKAPDATTGTAAASLVVVEKYCAAVGGGVNVRVRVTGSGSPLSGTVWAYDHNFQTSQSSSLDGDGRATFVMSDEGDSTFFYGGSDDWAPSMVTVIEDDRIGCGPGWYLGEIAMAS